METCPYSGGDRVAFDKVRQKVEKYSFRFGSLKNDFKRNIFGAYV
jgi:hypothetical protein